VVQFFSGTKTNPKHGLGPRYAYGAMNLLLTPSTPDSGESEFHFDDKKMVRLSQNAQQKLDNKFSYSKYDEQGRIVEVGELYTTFTAESLKDSLNMAHFPTAGHSDYVLSDVTKTHYDFGCGKMAGIFSQRFLRARVAWVEVIDKGATDTTATYYTYDVHGNVKSLLQHIPGLPDKHTDYIYDLMTGKVNYVFFQYGKADQFAHHYVYDANNRITEVYTSIDRFIWNKEAAYEYYLHGPLARVELGPYRSQGLDYYYTLQGWTKGVNMPFTGDPGKDGGSESLAGKDVFAYALGYYENDYKPSNGAALLSDTRDKMNARLQQHLGYAGLYNGNISWMVTDLAKIGEIQADRAKGMQGMMYRYDQLNRIIKSRSLTDYNAANGFAMRSNQAGAYDEDYSYDPNGNILALFRRNEAGEQMDDFDYEYYTGTNRLLRVRPTTTDTTYTGRVVSNRIIYKDVILKDGAYAPADVPALIRGTENIIAHPDFGTEDGAEFAAMIADDIPYIYNAIGNLVLDQAEGVSISWTPYGKVREVRSHNDSVRVKFRYDAVGNRVEKRVEKSDTTLITRYVRDAAGNVTATYTDTTAIEMFVFGSSRLGAYKGGAWEGDQTLGHRRYELANHLGNVLSVITDNIGMNTANTVWATVANVSDYYPFGLDMRGRSWRDTAELTFRYGFNGKEKDDNEEWGYTQYDYGERIYNSKIGRWLSTDFVAKAHLSPYQFASANPIIYMDPDGGDEFYFNTDGKLVKWVVTKDKDVFFVQTIKDVKIHYLQKTLDRPVSPAQIVTYEFKKFDAEDLGFVGNYFTYKDDYNLGDRVVLKWNESIWGDGAQSNLVTLSEWYVSDKNFQTALSTSNPKMAEDLGKIGGVKFIEDAALKVVEAIVIVDAAYGIYSSMKAYQAATNVVVDVAAANRVSTYNKLADPLLDCSDIASSMNKSINGGNILEITPKTGRWMNGVEYGQKAEFSYHQVFEKGGYVYDPMFGQAPVKTADFIKAYQEMNPGGIDVVKY
jgi:RHS repeat-associated protein